jgi:hypothetical protein
MSGIAVGRLEIPVNRIFWMSGIAVGRLEIPVNRIFA